MEIHKFSAPLCVDSRVQFSLLLFLLLSGRSASIASCSLLLQMEQHGLSVCLLVTFVSPAKTAEPIKM